MGRENNTKSVKDLLFRAQRLTRLANRSTQLNQFNKAFLTKLPTMLSQYCQVLDYQNGVLHVEVSSNAVATQLRFTKPQLLAKLRQSHPYQRLTDIDIKIAAPAKPEAKRQKRRPNSDVSTANRQLIRDTADYIGNDHSNESQNLAESMKKLATTLDKLGKN